MRTFSGEQWMLFPGGPYVRNFGAILADAIDI